MRPIVRLVLDLVSGFLILIYSYSQLPVTRERVEALLKGGGRVYHRLYFYDPLKVGFTATYFHIL